MRPVIEQALRIVAALPSAEPIQRTVLAAQMLDADPHGLDVDTPLHRLTVSLLGAAAGLDRDSSARAVWSAWSVLGHPVRRRSEQMVPHEVPAVPKHDQVVPPVGGKPRDELGRVARPNINLQLDAHLFRTLTSPRG